MNMRARAVESKTFPQSPHLEHYLNVVDIKAILNVAERSTVSELLSWAQILGLPVSGDFARDDANDLVARIALFHLAATAHGKSLVRVQQGARSLIVCTQHALGKTSPSNRFVNAGRRWSKLMVTDCRVSSLPLISGFKTHS